MAGGRSDAYSRGAVPAAMSPRPTTVPKSPTLRTAARSRKSTTEAESPMPSSSPKSKLTSTKPPTSSSSTSKPPAAELPASVQPTTEPPASEPHVPNPSQADPLLANPQPADSSPAGSLIPLAAAYISLCDIVETFPVYVGFDRKQYTLDKYVAARTSGFFAAATSGRWENTKEDGVALPDYEPVTFAIYKQWLQSNILMFDAVRYGPIPELDTALRQLIDLYVLGDFLSDSSFKLEVMRAADRVLTWSRDCPSAYILCYSYDQLTLLDSPLQQKIEWYWAVRVYVGHIRLYATQMPLDVFIRLSEAQVSCRKRTTGLGPF